MNASYQIHVKRLIDFLLSLALFIATLPLSLIITLCLIPVTKGKPFFVQERPGLKGKLFRIVKFRTMNDGRDNAGVLLPDADRLTSVGRFIRSTSLDELPQLLNVIIGDMSLVGPRPLLTDYLHLYTPHQGRRHEVRPGITGWAQVNGRNAIDWETKFDYDIWYVDHWSVLLDGRILYLTIRKVFLSDGIKSPTSATMEKFSGSV